MVICARVFVEAKSSMDDRTHPRRAVVSRLSRKSARNFKRLAASSSPIRRDGVKVGREYEEERLQASTALSFFPGPGSCGELW